MIKTAFWTVIVLVAVISTVGFLAARKSAGLEAPTTTDGVMPRCADKPNCVSSEMPSDHASYTDPIAVPVKTDGAATDDSDNRSLSLAQTHIESLGGRVTNISNNTMTAEFRSPLFGFVDDFLLQLDTGENVYRIRSSSRVGYSDLGANRKRVEALRQRINNQ